LILKNFEKSLGKLPIRPFREKQVFKTKLVSKILVKKKPVRTPTRVLKKNG